MKNVFSSEPDGVASRIARQTLARRAPDYTGEVRQFLDAGREVMRRCGTSSRPRVADIVAEAGLSNDAFYRHFASKDALVLAILEDGAERLTGYLAHQMEKESTPQGRLRRWVAGVLSQAADTEIAAATLAVLWNAGDLSQSMASPPPATNATLTALLVEPVAGLGSPDPALDASRRPRHHRPSLGPSLARRSTDPRRDRPPRGLLPGGRLWRWRTAPRRSAPNLTVTHGFDPRRVRETVRRSRPPDPGGS
jgi:AcrR family transcriptional regulator